MTTATPAEVNEAEERIREAQARIDSINQRRKDGSEAYAGIEEKTKEIQAQRVSQFLSTVYLHASLTGLRLSTTRLL